MTMEVIHGYYFSVSTVPVSIETFIYKPCDFLYRNLLKFIGLCNLLCSTFRVIFVFSAFVS